MKYCNVSLDVEGSRFNHHLQQTVNLLRGGKTLTSAVTSLGGGQFTVAVGDKSVGADFDHLQFIIFQELLRECEAQSQSSEKLH